MVTAVIPVRYGAQRFPGKPITPILGRPMIQWVIEGVQQAQLIDQILVATDDERIAQCCEASGVQVVMTPSGLASGTDRVHWAVEKVESHDLVINVQGDEPLIEGTVIDQLAKSMLERSSPWDMMTLGCEVSTETLASQNTAKIVLNQWKEAIYFSRWPIPYSRQKSSEKLGACLKHVGIYGYKKSFLKTFCQTPAQSIELMEGLEQLRALYLGARIPVIQVDDQGRGVDRPEDVPYVEEQLGKRYGRK